VPLAQLQALAEPKRLWIVDRLRDGEHCVCDLTEALDAGQSLLSHHLRVLKDAGLVVDRREGRWSYYSLVPGALAEVERWLEQVRADGERAAASVCCPR
jgi:ArsR family transcriptional regulator